MSSRVRYLMQWGGSFFQGPDVSRLIEERVGKAKSLAEKKEMATKMGLRLWVFREPRNVKGRRSRYASLCRAIGIGKPRGLKKKELSFADFLANGPQPAGNPPGIQYAIAGGHHGANNQPGRLAGQAKKRGPVREHPVHLDEPF